MVNEKTYLEICKQIDEYADVESLSAKELAALSYTSPATISRFCKMLGYNNFNELKVNLIEKRNMEKNHDNDVLNRWGALITKSLINIDKEMYDKIDQFHGKRIYVCCKREYELVTRQFTDILLTSGYNIVYINQDMNTININPENSIVLSVGMIPATLFDSRIEFCQVVFNNNNYISEYSNVNSIILVPPVHNNFDSLNMNYRVTCVGVLLSIIAERLCLIN